MKACEYCGKEIVRRTKEAKAQFAARRFCSSACSAHLNNRTRKKKPPAKNCLVCSAPLVQREDERISDFLERKSCDRKCATQLIRNGRNKPRVGQGYTGKQIAMLKQNPVSEAEADRLIAEYLKKRKPTRCETKFCADTRHAAVPEVEAQKRLKSLKVVANDSWKAIAFKTIRSRGREAA